LVVKRGRERKDEEGYEGKTMTPPVSVWMRVDKFG